VLACMHWNDFLRPLCFILSCTGYGLSRMHFIFSKFKLKLFQFYDRRSVPDWRRPDNGRELTMVLGCVTT
jgi:hypothetical protein